MLIPFSKYHGLGNDFLLFTGKSGDLMRRLDARVIQALCDRHEGVGADGILIREDSDKAEHRFILFNADGSRAEISGNGLRCFTLFLFDQGLAADSSRDLTIETDAGIFFAKRLSIGTVETTMPLPKFGGNHPKEVELNANGKTFMVVPVNVGNPHGVVFGPERDIPFAELYGPPLEHHSYFPEGANIEFVNVLSPRSCRLVVWERGAGITLACGSGSTATACAGAALGHFEFDMPIAVHQPGGTLDITVGKDFREIRQNGPAKFVFRGEVEI